MELNVKPIEYKGEKGYFLNDLALEKLKELIQSKQKEIEIAKGESKYKLKKLSKMLERANAKIARLIEDKKDCNTIINRSEQPEVSVDIKDL